MNDAKRQRIAVVTTSWPEHEEHPAGHFVRTHARDLEARGHAVVVLAPEPGGAFGWPGVAARLRERPWRVIAALSWVLAARARLKRVEVDRVVAHWAVPCAWPIALASDAPLDVISHGGDVRLLAASPRPAARRIVDAIASRASSWTFPSAATLQDLARVASSPQRIHAIARVTPPPLEMIDVAAAVSRLRGELGSRRVAVCVARLVPSKRVDVVLEHLARARDERGTLLVVVGDGPERPRLESLAVHHGVDALFVGTRPRGDALAWIGAADVLFHASEAEGLSTVVREAEQLGTRVVALGPAARVAGRHAPPRS